VKDELIVAAVLLSAVTYISIFIGIPDEFGMTNGVEKLADTDAVPVVVHRNDGKS
jgi:hypothetical protein